MSLQKIDSELSMVRAAKAVSKRYCQTTNLDSVSALAGSVVLTSTARTCARRTRPRSTTLVPTSFGISTLTRPWA